MVIGHNFIGGSRSAQSSTLLKSVDATTGETLPYEFHHATGARRYASYVPSWFGFNCLVPKGF